jgi:hypothetical protein
MLGRRAQTSSGGTPPFNTGAPFGSPATRPDGHRLGARRREGGRKTTRVTFAPCPSL